MTRCLRCSAKAPDGSRFCPACGAPALASSTPTRTHLETERPTTSSQPTLDQARFAPGDIMDKRYRIVALLGRGGMGEVYRADDLKLRQPFLGLLVRFGMLAGAALMLVTMVDQFAVLTLDFSAWYAGRSFFVLLLVVAVFVYAFYISRGRDRSNFPN